MTQTPTVAIAERAAVRAAMITFCTSTLPPLITAADAAVLAVDPSQPAIVGDPDVAFYRAAKRYMDRLISQGAVAGPNPILFRL